MTDNEDRLGWFGLVECKKDARWTVRCMMADVGGTRRKLYLTKKTWWGCVEEDMKSLRLCEEYVQVRNMYM